MGKSSKDKRDSYYRLAKEQGWRARSAFKLLQLNEQFHLFPTIDDPHPPSPCPSPPITRVIDLCAAPGSWSQVLSRHLSPLSTASQPITIIAMDLQPMTPLPGVTTLQADITHPTTLPLLQHHLSQHPADLVLSDGAPDVTGLHDLDEYIQSQLLLSALSLATKVLRPGGTFVAKIFRGRETEGLFWQLRTVFERVSCAKPRSSRGSSIEAFVVCQGFRGVVVEGGWEGGLVGIGKDGVDREVDGNEEDKEAEMERRFIAPFVACGDLSAWDSDATYQLDELADGVPRESMDPVQKPTAPPYKTALEMRRLLAGEAKGRERREKEKEKAKEREG